MDKIKIGNYLTELRKEKELSQNDLAEIIGVTFQAVSKWERGESIPDVAVIEQLAEFYEVSIGSIIKGEKEETLVKELQPQAQSKIAFTKEKRFYGFCFSVVSLVLFLIMCFMNFANLESTFGSWWSFNFYELIFGANYALGNYILLLRFLTILAIFILTSAFYLCKTKNEFNKIYLIRTIVIIVNLLTLIYDIYFMARYTSNCSYGLYILLVLVLTVDVLFLSLKINRKAYISQDFVE